ncbi:helix-turn-helix domain-containing protein [Embleya sp. AB8]|uniref:helix-turn-helix domain-containing protein n=1 Tax=Embleya sp. AB8 TaxID=3156304 RepID=UPI003C75A54C
MGPDDPMIRKPLMESAAVSVSELVCHEDQRTFRPGIPHVVPEVPVLLVLLVRSGGFLLRANGRAEFLDPTMGFVLHRGDDVAVSHPAHTHDVDTLLEIRRDVHDDAPDPVEPAGVPITAELDLAHRGLLAACRAGVDRFEVSERVHDLLAGLTGPAGRPDPASTGRRATTVLAHRTLVDRARAVLIDGPPAMGLEELSHQAGCSPAHLSRVFRLVTGETLTGYRNRLRVRAVADEITDGQPLRTLAAKYGFADQAHMTRVFRRYAGEVPTTVRDLVRAAGHRTGSGQESSTPPPDGCPRIVSGRARVGLPDTHRRPDRWKSTESTFIPEALQ